MGEEVVSTKTVRFEVPILNPVPVVDAQGQPLGSATVSYTSEGLSAEVYLDRHRPESFDLDVNPDRARITVRGNLDGAGLLLVITIDT